MKNIIGILLIVCLFALIFLFGSLFLGFKPTLFIFLFTSVVVGLSFISIELLCYEEKDETETIDNIHTEKNEECPDGTIEDQIEAMIDSLDDHITMGDIYRELCNLLENVRKYGVVKNAVDIISTSTSTSHNSRTLDERRELK